MSKARVVSLEELGVVVDDTEFVNVRIISNVLEPFYELEFLIWKKVKTH